MKRRYKLLLIIISCILLTYLIFMSNKTNKINILAIGDSIASGELSYNIDGISYNDYLKEYYKSKNILKSYDDNYAYKNNSIKEIILNLEDNNVKENKSINQLIYKANIITVGVLEEELIKLSMTKDLSVEKIKELIKSYDNLIKLIRNNNNSKIILIGLYKNKYLDDSTIILVNSAISNIANKYNAIFININDLIEEDNYYLNQDDYYFNYKAHKIIADMIINSL